MNTMLFNYMLVKLQNLLGNEEGQDLIEYALIAALIALAATAIMSSLGTGISTAFATISSDLAKAL